MKKSLLIAAALFAAFTINAKEIVVDLSTGVQVADEGSSAAISFADNVATVNWTVVGNWDVAGVEFPLDNLVVTGFSYEYQGDGQAFGLLSYLRDEDGNRWYEPAWISLELTEWTVKEAKDFETLWDGQAAEDFGKSPITKIGFIANPGYDEDAPDPFNVTGTFKIRNVKLTVPDETAVSNIEAQSKTTKVIRDGQMVILRDGKTYNALGTQLK